MAYNGSGTFNITTAGQPVVTGTVISSTAFNALTADLATGLSTAITKDGQTTTTVRVPFAQGISSTLTTDATSATTGSVISSGGVSMQKALWVGTSATVATTLSVGTTLNFGGFAAEGTVTAAATTDLSTSTANRQSVTGNTTITSFGTGANSYRIIRFTGNPLLTYNATSLITPTGASIQAAPGDVATLTSDGSGNWRIIDYLPYGGTVTSTFSAFSMGTSYGQCASLSLTPGRWRFTSAALVSRGSAISDLRGAISTTTASNAGTTAGTTYFSTGPSSATGIASLTMPSSDVTLTATTTYYFNSVADAVSGTFGGIFQAQRII